MFRILSKKNNRFVGMDFGTSAIKVVELSYDSREQKPRLENYGWFDMAGILQGLDMKQKKFSFYEEKLKTVSRNLLKKLDVDKDTQIHVSIPGFSGLAVLIEFPKMSNDEIEKAIEFEAHKYIPTAIDEVSISWEILENPKDDETENAGKNKINVLLVAAPKREIEKYKILFEGTGLRISSVELETFSIARVLVGREKGISIIMDMGSRASNIMLVKDGTVLINRSVDMGGDDITSAIADSLNISKQRAETFKREGKDFLNDKETAIVIPVLELLGGEIRRIVTAFKEKHRKENIDRFIISGGSSNLTGIDKYFKNMLGMDADRVDPWKKISYDSKLVPVISKIGGSFSVALGLALRGVEESNLKNKK